MYNNFQKLEDALGDRWDKEYREDMEERVNG